MTNDAISSDSPDARILLVRLSAIGDVLHTLPVACALRDRFPKAHIVWLVEGRTADLLRGHPALNQIHALPRGWLKSPRAVWTLAQTLRAERFSLAIDPQGLFKSAFAARLSGAARRIGFASPASREGASFFYTDRVTPTAVHVVDRNLELLRPLGIEQPVVRFDVPVDPAAEANMAAALGDARGFAVVNPGAGWPSKRWPPERFAAVARHLSETRGLSVLVAWAGPEERAWAETITQGGGARLAPETRLPELAALLRRTRICVGSDTGPLHLAAALGVPCVGLYGPMPAERNGPYGAGHVALQRQRIDGTSRERRNASPAAMEAISVADVVEACDRLLGVS